MDSHEFTEKRNFAAIEEQSEEESQMNFPESQSSNGNERQSQKNSSRNINRKTSQNLTMLGYDGSKSKASRMNSDAEFDLSNEPLSKSNSMHFEDVMVP